LGSALGRWPSRGLFMLWLRPYGARRTDFLSDATWKMVRTPGRKDRTMPRHPKPEPHVQFTIRLPLRHVEVLRARAAEEDRTASAEVRRLVKQYAEASKTKQAA
jgi:hypothetical protein